MPALLELRQIQKYFGACHALKNVSLKVRPGEIVGIIGENGAGKSTSMNIAYGLYAADKGEIIWQGKPVTFSSPAEARAAGIGMVHQHFALSPRHSVLENVLVSQGGSPLRWIHRNKYESEMRQKARDFGFSDFPWRQSVEALSVGEQQQLEIFKALLSRPQLLILDEPTAVLTPSEVQILFTNLRKFKSAGTSVVIITHKLKEIMQETDRVYVLRGGENALSANTAEADFEQLATAMVGPREPKTIKKVETLTAEALLKIENLKIAQSGATLDLQQFKVHRGETLGIAGVEGNGQDLLIQALLAPRSLESLTGHISFLGHATQSLPTSQILTLGLRALPEDRLRYGVMEDRSGLDNFVLGHQKIFSTWRGINWSNARGAAREQFAHFDVRPQDPSLKFCDYSGGNQQKIVVARELFHRPQLLVAAHPTRGVDLKAAEFIRSQISKVAGSGSVLLISSDLDELFEMSDRILVLYKGRVQKEFLPSEFKEALVGSAMAGRDS